MSPTDRRVRLTPEVKQELLSRDQFRLHVSTTVGWIVRDLSPDLGEGFELSIWDSGQFSGISFPVQLKSVAVLDKLRIKRNRLSFRVEVKDLLHWQASTIPVILVVWDIVQNCGYWLDIPSAIASLNARVQNWTSHNTVKVHIPESNVLDAVGFQRIREYLVDYLLPSYARDKSLQLDVTFRFPSDDEGKTSLEAVQAFLKTGAEFEVQGKYIESMEFSDWYQRLSGAGTNITSDSLLRSKPLPSSQKLPVSIHLIDSQERSLIELKYVELQLAQSGTETAVLSNKFQQNRWVVELQYNKLKDTWNYRVSYNSDDNENDLLDIQKNLDTSVGMVMYLLQHDSEPIRFQRI